jgi:hypothetical protein
LWQKAEHDATAIHLIRAVAPRRAGRHEEHDYLFVYLSMHWLSTIVAVNDV